MDIFSSKIPIASAAFLLIAASAFLLPDLAVFYINNQMVDPVNTDAEFPSEEFEGTNLYGPEGQKLEPVEIMRSDSGSLEKRLKIAGTGLFDTAEAGSEVFEVAGDFGKDPEYLGTNTSPEGCKQPYGCENGYPNVFSDMYTLWLSQLTERGNIGDLYDKDSAREEFIDFTRRAEFYDSYLDPDGYEMREIEAAYYSSKSGLFVVGSGNSTLSVDGEKIKTETEGALHHSQIELETGIYKVRRGDSDLELAVHPKIRDFMVEEEEVLVLEAVKETRYREIEVYYEDEIRDFDLNRSEISIPLGDEPQRLSFVGDIEVNRSLDEEEPEYEPIDKLASGMSREEYRRFRSVAELLGIQRGFQGN